MRRIAFLFLLFPIVLSAQEDCELFNLQDLAAENLVLHDSIANFAVDTIILQSDGSFEVQLSNGTTFTQVLGCTDPTYVEYDSSANTDDGSCSTLATWCSSASTTMDGYSYNVVEIGDQCWFAENLRTTVYANGDPIPSDLTDEEWASSLDFGATCVYGEGSSACYSYGPDIDACDEAQSLAEYGRLYNSSAVDDARGLCPSGWRVPDGGDWNALEGYVVSQVSTDSVNWSLASTTGWPFLITDSGFDFSGGGDVFGFSALPGGIWNLNGDGSFYNSGDVAYFAEWDDGVPTLRLWFLDKTLIEPDRGAFPAAAAASVRCIKCPPAPFPCGY